MRTLRQIARRWVPNIEIGIPHVERNKRLKVRCREHLGLIIRGTKGYEPRYVSALRKVINEDAIVYDVGANIGFYSVLFSGWVGPRGKVIAFEPDPANIQLLQRNLQLNGCDNVVVRPVALTNACGEQEFSLDRITRMTGHLGSGPTYGASVFGDNKPQFINAMTSTLDVEVERFGPPDVIKMDIEGGEHQALLGGTRLLQSKRPIIVSEMNSWAEEAEGVKRDPPGARYLLEQGYALWDPDAECEVHPDSIPWTVVATPSESNYISLLRAKSVNSSGER